MLLSSRNSLALNKGPCTAKNLGYWYFQLPETIRRRVIHWVAEIATRALPGDIKLLNRHPWNPWAQPAAGVPARSNAGLIRYIYDEFNVYSCNYGGVDTLRWRLKKKEAQQYCMRWIMNWSLWIKAGKSLHLACPIPCRCSNPIPHHINRWI